MDIVLIGSGNAATVIGRKALAAGHRILQVYSRQTDHATALARLLDCEPVISLSLVKKNADLTIIALRDDGVRIAAESIGDMRSVVVHTAGALPIQDLRYVGASYGVLYPLQSLRKEITELPPLTILTDGNNNPVRAFITKFALSIAETVMEAGDVLRMRYHLAGTLVNNFTNYLFVLAEQFCEKEGIAFSVLQPLIEETGKRLRTASPADLQTGPAWRNDTVTIEKHRQLLQDQPDILKFYELFTRCINDFHQSDKLG